MPKWLAMAFALAVLLAFALVLPSVSAQEEIPSTSTGTAIVPTPFLTEEPTEIPPETTPQPTEIPTEQGESVQPFSAFASSVPMPPDSDCSDGQCVFWVKARTDDAGLHPACTYSTSYNEIYMGECTNRQGIVSGFRFPNVTIPAGMIIQEAYIEFTVDGPYTDELNVAFYGEASGNANPFSTTSRPSNRPLTVTSSTWSIPSTDRWELGQLRDSPDLTAIVQEIVNRPDWISGNALAIIVKNAGPASGTYRHRRVIGYDRPVWYPGTENAARLVIRLGYDCTDYKDTLSNIGQAVFDVVGEQNYCLNKFKKLTFIEDPSSGRVAFQEFAELASQAKYEVDFTTMIWDHDTGEIFLEGVKELYEKVKSNPGDYPDGIQVRILLGLEHYFDIFDQRVTVLNMLYDLEIPLNGLNGNWKVEVATYRNSKPLGGFIRPNTHSHVKILIVDGKEAIVSGYNFQDLYLDSSMKDAGIKISGPIVQASLLMFDGLWDNGRGLSCNDIVFCAYTTTPLAHPQEVLSIQPATSDPVNVFSLFRNETVKTADDAIAQAIRASNTNVNLLQNRYFENYPPETVCRRICFDEWLPESFPSGQHGPFPYTQAIIYAMQNGAQIQMLLSGDIINMDKNVNSLEKLRTQILSLQNGTDIYSKITVKFSKDILHAKALSIDNQFVIVGSQNFDYSSFGDDPNNIMDLAEYSLGVDNQNVANEFDAKFDALWEVGKNYLSVTQSIQQTIDQASPGAIIYIPAGVYRESLIINKPLTLIGDSTNQSIIEPPLISQNTIQATSSGIAISHLTIRRSNGYGIALIDISPSSLKNIQINNIVFDNNSLSGILVQGLIPGSPIQYTFENNIFVGGQSGLVLNLLETQQNSSLVRNNIFIGQSSAPIKILSTGDGGVEYSYNLFSICGSNLDCSTKWHLGNLASSSNTHDNLFNLDPLFLDPGFSDYRLSPSSPLVDAGDPNTAVFDEYNDSSFRVDIGAFESFLTLEQLPPLADDIPNFPGLISEISKNNMNLRYFINPSSDEDWFRFQITEAGNLQVHLTSLPANYDLYIYNAAGQLLGSSSKEKKAAEMVKINNAIPGYYYVRIVGADGAWNLNNPYQLRFSVVSAGVP